MKCSLKSAMSWTLGILLAGGAITGIAIRRHSHSLRQPGCVLYAPESKTFDDPWPPIPTPPPPLPSPIPRAPQPHVIEFSAVPTPPPPLPTSMPKPRVPWAPQRPSYDSGLYEAAMSAFLNALEAEGLSSRQQSLVLVAPEGEWLAAHQPQLAVSATVFGRILTSVKALETWSPDYRFKSEIYEVGSLDGTTLSGSLWVQGAMDPLWVDDPEPLIERIEALGIQQVTKGLMLVKPGYRGEAAPWIMGRSLLNQLNLEDHPSHQLSINRSLGVMNQLPPQASLLVRHVSPPLTEVLNRQHITGNEQITELLVTYLQQVRPIDYDLGADTLATAEMIVAALQHLQEQVSSLSQILVEVGTSEALAVGELPLGTLVDSSRTLNQGEVLLGQLPNGIIFVLVNQGGDPQRLQVLQDRFLNDVMLLDQFQSR